MPDPDRPVVAVLRREWLRPSETFVRDHVATLSRWSPVTGAFLRVAHPLSEPDCSVAPATLPVELALRHGPHRPWDRRLARALARHDPRVLHVHFGVDAFVLLGVHERLGVPLVVTFHGYDVSAKDNPVLKRYFARIQQVFDAAHTLIAVSGFVHDQLLALGAPAAKIRTHVNGIALERFAAAPEPDVADPSILFVGRLVEKKGLGDLLAAMASLPGELRGTRLDVVGDGPLGESLRAQARDSGLTVTFHEQATHARVAELMRRARVVCVPSRQARDGDTEGLPTAAVEAAASGAPVVGTRHAGIPEIVRDGVNGLLGAEGDVAALADNLARLLADPDLARQLGRAGQAIAHAEFDMRTQVAGLEQMYDAAVGSAPR